MTVVYYKGNYLTSWSQNLVLAKLPSSGFRREWNRVKMAKNGLKMVEFFQGGSHMMKSNILNIFCFSTFSSTNFTNPVFWPNLKKIALKTRSRKYPKEKVKKTKNDKNVIIYHIQPFLSHFWPFLPHFSWQICHFSKNLNSTIWSKPDSDSYW